MKYSPMEKSMIKKGKTYYPPKCPNDNMDLEWNFTLKAWICKWCGYEINHYHKFIEEERIKQQIGYP